MFKNFNHKFVYKFPLVWNTKIVPFLILALVFHLIFFAVGYSNAIVKSVEFHDFNYQDDNAITINVFAILIAVLIFIIWILLYVRNNAFKAFYPKNNTALFKEWLLIVLFCLANFSYPLTAMLAANVQTRNIMPRELALNRCETISKASLFLQGSYNEGYYVYDSIKDMEVRRKVDSFAFEGRNYDLKSLMNKNIETYPFFSSQKDSLMRLEVQHWMKENNKEAVLKTLKDYAAIAKEHQLESNITSQKWLDLVYDYPEFTNYKVVGTAERELEYRYNDDYEIAQPVVDTMAIEVVDELYATSVDTSSVFIKVVDGQAFVYSKYYVTHKPLYRYYERIAKSWERPLVEGGIIAIFLFICFGIALLVFSFKVTSVKSWLIALISMGVVQLLLASGTIVLDYSHSYPILFVLLFVLLCVGFTLIYLQKRGKKWSGIFLNQILWMLLGFLPMVYTIAMKIVKEYSGYYDRYDLKTGKYIEEFPKIDWLNENEMLLHVLNLVIVIIIVYLLSGIIKKWRGITEE